MLACGKQKMEKLGNISLAPQTTLYTDNMGVGSMWQNISVCLTLSLQCKNA